MHMRHVIPNLQFGFCSGGFGALDKAGCIVKQHFFRTNLDKKRARPAKSAKTGDIGVISWMLVA